ncbi:MAG: hypothetical protein ABSE69_09655 [Roseiarcus sp.]|jgi:hypothetical protein
MDRIALTMFRASAAFATLLMARSMVAEAGAVDAGPTKPPLCSYRDANYGPNAVICVAPEFGQTCGKDGTWLPPASEKACANAQIPVPGIPPAQCMYHDVKYSPNAVICVAPRFGQICNTDGVWKPATDGGGFDKACANAQIPAPTYPAAPAAAKSQ